MHICILAEEKIHIVNVYAPVANIIPLDNSKLTIYKELQKYINKLCVISRRKFSIFQNFVLLFLFSVIKQSLGKGFGVPS